MNIISTLFNFNMTLELEISPLSPPLLFYYSSQQQCSFMFCCLSFLGYCGQSICQIMSTSYEYLAVTGSDCAKYKGDIIRVLSMNRLVMASCSLLATRVSRASM